MSRLTRRLIALILTLVLSPIEGLAQVYNSTIPPFATPSAQVGTSAIAGTSIFTMRADGAPAINQAMAPTWTGRHNWASGGWINLTTTGATEGINITHSLGNGVSPSLVRPIDLFSSYTATDTTGSTYSGIHSSLTYGSGGVASKGTVTDSGWDLVVSGNGDATAEYANNISVIRMDIGCVNGGATCYTQTAGPTGRAWGQDFSVHGSLSVQPNLLNGITQYIAQYYNGSPSDSPAGAFWAVTHSNAGGGKDTNHGAATTYPVDVAFGATGNSGGTTGVGFTVAFKCGGLGSGWMESGSSRIGTCGYFQDYDTYGLRFVSPYSGTTPPSIVVEAGAGNVGIQMVAGTVPSVDLAFGGNAQRSIGMERHTTANTAGNPFTIQGSGATVGATNKAGGNLVLQPGPPTGSGTNNIIWNSYTAGTGAVATIHNVPSAPGTGYVVNDVLTMTSGSNDATATVLTVDGGGGVLTVSFLAAGTSGYQVGSGKATTSSPSSGRSGCTLIIKTITQTATADGILTERMRLVADGNLAMLGIGTSAPTSALSVGGTWVTSNGTFATVSGALLSSNTSQIAGLSASTSIRPTGASIASVYGLVNIPSLAFSTANVTSTISASFSRVDSAATYTGTIANARTYEAANPSLLGTNPASFYTHFYGAPLTNGNGSALAITNTGIDITVATAASGGGTFVSTAGKFGVPSGSAATQTNRGVWITGNGGAASINWALYSDSTGNSSLLGPLSVKTQSAPTAWLMLAAGSTAASSAPLKFNSGSLMTTAEVGAVEFLTDAAYITTTTGTTRRMVVAGSVGRSAGATGAVASLATFTLPATDSSFEVSANVLVTTSTSYNFTVTVAYTDEGNTARTATLLFNMVGGALTDKIINTGGAVPYMGIPQHIRCKASTAITLATTGTFTTVTYNAEGSIRQIG